MRARSMRSLLAGLLVLTAAGCSQAEHAKQGLQKAYDSAADAGRQVRLPNAGDVGLDEVSTGAVHDELAELTALVPDGADTKAVLATACDAKTRYETGAAHSTDQAASEALRGRGLDVRPEIIARIEQHLIHAAESSNPAPAAAAVYACKWAAGS